MSEANPTPWQADLAPSIKKGDETVLINGNPPRVDIRILSEPNYQLALKSVNAMANRKTFVIMANDFPEGVMDDEAKAKAFVIAKNAADKDRAERDNMGRIYWRCYEFELNKEP